MKKNYLLPFRVCLLCCMVFSSSFAFGQKTSTKVSLKSLPIRSPLPTKDYSASKEQRQKDIYNGNVKKDSVNAVNLKVAASGAQKIDEVTTKVTGPENVPPVFIEKAEVATFRKVTEVKGISITEIPIK